MGERFDLALACGLKLAVWGPLDGGPSQPHRGEYMWQVDEPNGGKVHGRGYKTEFEEAKRDGLGAMKIVVMNSVRELQAACG